MDDDTPLHERIALGQAEDEAERILADLVRKLDTLHERIHWHCMNNGLPLPLGVPEPEPFGPDDDTF
jgi:hypothetical protein